MIIRKTWAFIIDLFHFTEETFQQDPDLHMGSLQVDFLFTSTTQSETINICISSFFNDYESPPKIF